MKTVTPSVLFASSRSCDLVLTAGVETECRLIEEYDLGTVYERLRNAKTLLHAARKAADGNVFFLVQTDAAQKIFNICRLIVPGVKQRGEVLEILLRRHRVVVAVRFGYNADHSADVHGLLCYVHAVYERRTARGLQEPIEHADSCSFAGTVRTEETEDIALVDLKIKSVNGFEAVFIYLCKPLCADHCSAPPVFMPPDVPDGHARS